MNRRVTLVTTLLLLVGCVPSATPTTPPTAAATPTFPSASSPGGPPPGSSGPGSVEPSQEPPSGDPRERYVAGTIIWDAVDAGPFRTKTVSGRLELVLHNPSGGLWIPARGEGSVYTYDVTLSDCTPDGHLSGVIESGVGFVEPEWHIAIANVLQTEFSATADLQMDFYLHDEWDVTCTPPTGQPYPFTPSGAGLFPGCAVFAQVIADNDGAGNYTIECDVAVPSFDTWSGHISGTLHTIEGPVASP